MENKKLTQKQIDSLLHDDVEIFIEDFKGDCNKEDADLIIAMNQIREKYPEYNFNIFHVVNESMMPVQGRRKAKLKGLVKGVSDILITLKTSEFGMAAIECKRRCKRKSRLSHEQVLFLNHQIKAGNYAAVAYVADMIFKAVDEYIKKVKQCN